MLTSSSWVDWYADGILRSIGTPSGELTVDIAGLTQATVANEILPQVADHLLSATDGRRLDHRLHRAGTLLFAASRHSCAAFIAAYFIDHGGTVAHAADFVALSAGLPAIDTAFFGIRVQGDFAGTAARAMFAHLGEWRLSHQQRRLELA